ncbi:MAG: glycosyltransferase family 39 protein [Candidatus Glassbacteria bacterium]|nr:glycosyltransferase family 39 protein [Candidatus Glassbacteria bacterium]
MNTFSRSAIGLLVRRRYLWLSLLCGLLYLVNLGGYRLFDVDEPRYAETARYMTAVGDYVVPIFNGRYRFEKPVLSYWLIAGSYKLFGTGEGPARLSAALCALGTVLLTCLLAGRLRSPGQGLAAGAVLACCIQFIGLGRTAVTDMPLCFFFTATLVLFYLGYAAAADSRARIFYLGSFGACGLAVLTKGPVGLVLPGAIAGAFVLSRARAGPLLKRIPWVAGTLLLLATILPWYLAVNLRSGNEFYRVFILQHNFQRYFGRVDSLGQHLEPFYFYLPCLLAGFYPWSFYTLQAVWEALKRFTGGLRKKLLYSEGTEAFAFIWFALVMIFFSLSRAKLPTYITPAFPPLAILTVDYWVRRLGPRRACEILALKVPALLGFLVASALAVALVLKGPELAGFPLGNLPLLTGIVLVTGPAAALAFLLRNRPAAAVSAQVAAQLIFAWVLAFGILPQVSRYRQEPQVRLVEKAIGHTGDNGTLAAFRYRKTALVFYSRRVVRFLEAHERAALDSLASPLAVITRDRHLAQLLESAPELKLLARDHDLVLLGR